VDNLWFSTYQTFIYPARITNPGGGLGRGVRRPLQPETVDMPGPKPGGRFLKPRPEAGV